MVGVARAQQKALGIATSLCALALILRLTLKPLGGPLPSGFHWCLFCGSFGAADFVLNILLFIPLGWGLRQAGIPRWPIYLFGLALAVTIETLQDFVISGREAGLNDVVANPLGGVLGVWLADHMHTLLAPNRNTSRRLALGAATAWIVLAGVLPWLMRPSLPRTQYWEQVAPDLPKYGKYTGEILSATYNGQPFRQGRLSDSASAAMRHAFLDGAAQVEVTTVAAPSAGRVAPIVSVFDGEEQEIFMVACAGGDLVFGVRTRLDDLKFHSPAHRLHGVIPCDAPSAADTIRITASVDRIGLKLAVERNGRIASSRPDPGAWQAWRLLVSDSYGRQARFAAYLTALWVVLCLVPLGYWLARMGRRTTYGLRDVRYSRSQRPDVVQRPSWPFRLGVSVATLAVTLAIIPVCVGSRLAPLPVWIAGAAGIVLGFALALWDREAVWT
jgi:VanZ like family